ncbi:MAG: hypothetical protein ABJG47_16005 [Ekhidna sp.]
MKKLWISLSIGCCFLILSGFDTVSTNNEEASFWGCTQTVRGCDTSGDGQPDIFYSLQGGPAPLPSNFNPALYTVPNFGCANITFSVTCPPPPPPPPPGGGTIQVNACDTTGEGQPDVFYSLSGGPAPLPSGFNPALYTVTPGGCDIISIVL